MLWASAALALTISACGGGSTSSTSSPGSAQACVNAGAAHRAYLVVEHLSGKSVQRCVGFNGGPINADDLMKQSGIEYQAQAFSGLGKAVCQVDNEPAQFSECFPKDKPFWALLISTGGAPWADSQTGYTSVNLKDGDALGWQYRSATASPAPSPPPLPKK
jgi:hypothetical protein